MALWTLQYAFLGVISEHSLLSFVPTMHSTSYRLHGVFGRLNSWALHAEKDLVGGVHLTGKFDIDI